MKKILFVLSIAVTASSFARQPSLIEELTHAYQARSAKAPASGLIESAFSPEAGSEELVLKVIHASEHSIRLAAYSFTSPTIVKALLAAKKRGVDVRVVVDERGNKGKSSIAALNLLVNAAIPTRTIATYTIHHDKFIISDQRHLQNGSFNYSQAAAKSNSENVLVVWNNPELAVSFLEHWQSRWDQGVEFKSTY
jgi:phosphatidylserine/phosphatidylglycerophosphate/cardiolipin synthase-like enzyme